MSYLIIYSCFICYLCCSEIVTASVDKTLSLWDLHSGERVKKLKGHQSFVNCCDVARRGPQLICSGSDDGTVKVSPEGIWEVKGQT